MSTNNFQITVVSDEKFSEAQNKLNNQLKNLYLRTLREAFISYSNGAYKVEAFFKTGSSNAQGNDFEVVLSAKPNFSSMVQNLDKRIKNQTEANSSTYPTTINFNYLSNGTYGAAVTMVPPSASALSRGNYQFGVAKVSGNPKKTFIQDVNTTLTYYQDNGVVIDSAYLIAEKEHHQIILYALG